MKRALWICFFMSILFFTVLLSTPAVFAADFSYNDTSIEEKATKDERNQITYLFLLSQQTAETRKEAIKKLKELGMTVTILHGTVAIEALGNADQAKKSAESGIFILMLDQPANEEALNKLDKKQRQIVEIWSARFSPEYSRLKEDKSKAGKPWESKKMKQPFPYTAIPMEDFVRMVHEYEKRTGKILTPKKTEKKRRMTPQELVEYERTLTKIYGDPTIAYHLARLAYRLSPEWYDVIKNLPKDLLDKICETYISVCPAPAPPAPACWEMTGIVSVGIVFVESSLPNGPKFGTSERANIQNRITDGLSWLSTQHPQHNLSWLYDVQNISINVPNGNLNCCSGEDIEFLESAWRDPAMGAVTYNGNTYSASWSGIGDYRNDMNAANFTNYAFVIFVTPYANCWHGYAGGYRIVLAKNSPDYDNWGGWGVQTVNMIAAHEAAHLFGAADEYKEDPCTSCTTSHGCDNILNSNCAECAKPLQDCMMDQNSQRVCPFTRGQIGWSKLFVMLNTADQTWAGTDDDVRLDIGDGSYVLDTPGHDDREKGYRDGYSLYISGLQQSQIKRFLIRKSEDSMTGGWKLKRVRGWYEGTLICDVDNIDQWLEDDYRIWVGCIQDQNLVNTLTIKISTADVRWAGTDDDVRITLDGHSWNLDNSWHNDFERGNTDTFKLDPGTGFYRDTIHSVKIHKSSDGVAGGWKLKGVEVIVNGTTLYNNQSINKWLEDDDRDWSASF